MTVSTPVAPPSLFTRLMAWARRTGLSRKLTVALTIGAVCSVVATYAAITGFAPFGPDPNLVLGLLNLDLVLVLTLGVLISRRLVRVWAERRRGQAGSRLHTRLVLMFGLVAVTPAIVVAIFSALFLNVGIQGWFSERVRTALDSSREVAEAYLHEHQQVIRADILAMAADLNRDSQALFDNPQRLAQIVQTQAALRSLSEAVVFDRNGRVWARSGFTYSLEFQPVPPQAMQQARDGDVAILTSESDDRVRALVRLDGYTEVFLYVGRFVEPKVINYVESTRRAVDAYDQLEGQRSGLQITFALIFVVVALLLLLAAVWVGLALANKLALPIGALVTATDRLGSGDLTVRVGELDPADELGSLSRAFNRMASQIEAQRSELIDANQQLDLRRRFTEAVLGGVSAGVIGLNREGAINLPNRSATELLSTDLERAIGRPLAESVPEMAELLESARQRPDRLAEGQIKLTRDGASITLLVRVTAERNGDDVEGFVVTFDDVTNLLAAQRTAAWADVARRIAHEIKNPLTPIQLSAERLKRKYLKQITSDPETFIACTDTIVRQVGDIGRMVDEFSAFARMPAPVLKSEDLVAICREVLFLQRQGNPSIKLELDSPVPTLSLHCDSRQIRQALINLIQNAIDAFEGLPEEGVKPEGGNRVILRILDEPSTITVQVVDNGKGLPTDLRDRLTEPYVTTRAKGTGLGLAIVKKIMEDHSGTLRLDDAPGGGARISLIFIKTEQAADPVPSLRAVAHGA